jgi:hypothetical protein
VTLGPHPAPRRRRPGQPSRARRSTSSRRKGIACGVSTPSAAGREGPARAPSGAVQALSWDNGRAAGRARGRATFALPQLRRADARSLHAEQGPARGAATRAGPGARGVALHPLRAHDPPRPEGGARERRADLARGQRP